MTLPELRLDAVACPLSGTVLVALMNDPATLSGLGAAVQAAPYKAAPCAPVLGVKPRNTWVADGARVAVPPEGVVVAASLAAVVGRTTCRVPAAQALAHVAGYTLALDLHLPPADAQAHYRPAIRQRARDGFCPLAAQGVAASRVADPDALGLAVAVCAPGVATRPAANGSATADEGERRWRGRTGGRVRGLSQLLSDVSDFMTLHPGDLLLLGGGADAPIAHAGDTVLAELDGVATLRIHLVADSPAPHLEPHA